MLAFGAGFGVAAGAEKSGFGGGAGSLEAIGGGGGSAGAPADAASAAGAGLPLPAPALAEIFLQPAKASVSERRSGMMIRVIWLVPAVRIHRRRGEGRRRCEKMRARMMS